MTKYILVALCVVLFGTLASATFNSRCPNPTGQCTATAFATATAVATGGSSCTVRSNSNAYCGTFTSELQGCYTRETLYDQGSCRSIRPRDDAKCFITVAAAAYASAFVRAECTDGSMGCGSANSVADAEVVGCYIANSIVELANQLGTYTPECDTAVVDAVNAMASAAANAESAACSANGVLGLDADFAFDVEVRKIVSAAFKKCWIYCSRENNTPSPSASASPAEEKAEPSPAAEEKAEPSPAAEEKAEPSPSASPSVTVAVESSARGDVASATADVDVSTGSDGK